jgi:hypothetical protein
MTTYPISHESSHVVACDTLMVVVSVSPAMCGYSWRRLPL